MIHISLPSDNIAIFQSGKCLNPWVILPTHVSCDPEYVRQ